jgi:hypothetical protein
LARKAGTTRTTTKPKAQAPRRRDAQQRASSEQLQSPDKQPQAKSSKSSNSGTKQDATGSSKLAALLESPVIRNVLAAGLFSAAAALVYRKPKAVVVAGEHVQEAASELMDGAVDVVRATRKTARKVSRKASVAVQAVASPSAAPETKPAQPDGSITNPPLEAGARTDADRPKRKRRSDAGVTRAARVSPPIANASTGSAPETTVPSANLHETETSAFALSAVPSEAEPVPDSADEPAVKADRS